MEPSRVRPRFDYSDPARGNQYRGKKKFTVILASHKQVRFNLSDVPASFVCVSSDNYGAGSSMYPGPPGGGYYGSNVRLLDIFLCTFALC